MRYCLYIPKNNPYGTDGIREKYFNWFKEKYNGKFITLEKKALGGYGFILKEDIEKFIWRKEFIKDLKNNRPFHGKL